MSTTDRSALSRYGWLSVAAALITIALKLLAWRLTNSVGLLSDALESFVNLAAAIGMLVALRVASRPADAEHPFGHGKAEYFASGFEGSMIFAAAVAIGWASVDRLLHPRPLEEAGLGLALSTAASVVNLVVALLLMRAGKQHRSIALEADGKHLLTDVWTSVGVLLAVGLVWVTGWQVLDPLIALAVAVHIIWIGAVLMRRSFAGLLDAAIPEAERAEIEKIFAEYRKRYGVEFHALLTRQAGARRFISFHLLVPDAWPVDRAHQLSEEIEERVRSLVPNAITFSHIEPISQPASYDDIKLERW